MIDAPTSNGFTLIELLFALVAGSLLLVALGWAIGGLERQLRRTDVMTAADQVLALAPLLDATLAHAYPPAKGAALSGTPSALTVSVPPLDVLGAIGPVRLTLAVEDHSGDAELFARLAPDRPDRALPSGATAPRRLARGFKTIRFEYLRAKSDGSSRLPRLVTILFTARDGTTLPLAIEPRLSMNADCVFDPISLTCRR